MKRFRRCALTIELLTPRVSILSLPRDQSLRFRITQNRPQKAYGNRSIIVWQQLADWKQQIYAYPLCKDINPSHLRFVQLMVIKVCSHNVLEHSASRGSRHPRLAFYSAVAGSAIYNCSIAKPETTVHKCRISLAQLQRYYL